MKISQRAHLRIFKLFPTWLVMWEHIIGIFCSEITLAEFQNLLKEVAPKYQKDAKLGSPEEALAAMQEKIVSKGPSTAGTTVSRHISGVLQVPLRLRYAVLPLIHVCSFLFLLCLHPSHRIFSLLLYMFVTNLVDLLIIAYLYTNIINIRCFTGSPILVNTSSYCFSRLCWPVNIIKRDT